MATIKGKVKWFNPKKRYGYITDSEGNDHFVHASGIKEARMVPSFEDGDEVEFELTNGKKGQQATNVVLVTKVEDMKDNEEPTCSPE